MEEEFPEQRCGKSYSGFLGKKHKKTSLKYILNNEKRFAKSKPPTCKALQYKKGYKKWLGYAAINTTRSMLSAVLKKKKHSQQLQEC